MYYMSKRDSCMSKKERQQVRDLSSVGNASTKAYRQKILLKQAGQLTRELERNRQEERETRADGIIRQRVIKRKGTRIAYRIVGVLFVLAGVACMWWAMGGHYRIPKAVVAIVLMAYGFYVIRASFRSSAYDAMYLFGQDVVTILQKKGSVVIPYEKVTGYTMIEPDPDLRYYIIKFDVDRQSYIVPFAGAKGKCDKVYNILREKVRTDEGENT